MFLKNKIYLCIVGILCCKVIVAQTPNIEILEQGQKTSIRGMSVVNNRVVWVSGSNGLVGKSLDGGETWNWITVYGYEKSDFRDIEAFDENTALIMGITQPAVILKTKDGGLTWKKVFEDTANAAFFDAMDFTIIGKDTLGILIGDPLEEQFYHVLCSNAGDNWTPRDTQLNQHLPLLQKGEAFFASSGTNIVWLPMRKKNIGHRYATAFFVSGGTASYLYSIPFNSNKSIPLSLIQGKQSTGANSISIDSKKRKGMIVGGDFNNDTSTNGNAAIFSFDKKNRIVQWYQPTTPPHGYRSCITFMNEDHLISCGTSGVDISKDGGMNWELISKEGFHVVQKAKKGNALFLAGKGGRIARFVYK